MVTNNTMRQRIDTKVYMLVLFGLVPGLRADEISLMTPKLRPEVIRTLSFPSGQWIGNLYLEPESGPGWDPIGVRLLAQWNFLSAARGEVRAPEDRNIKLYVLLALSPREAASLQRQNPRAHQLLIADRACKDPADLSGLSELDPYGLFWLAVESAMWRRTGADPQIFEPISRLTGLEILTLNSTGITDEGLEHLRPLRSLKGLELTQVSIGNRGLAVLKDLPALEYLFLGTSVTDAGLKQVAQVSSLRWLNVVEGKMWGPGLAELARLPRLERLCIASSKSTSDRHVKYLEGVTQLKGLTFWYGCDTLTDASLASIGKIKNLEELYFVRTSPKFTPGGIAHLKSLTNLKKVDFAQAWASLEGEQYGDEVARQLTGLPHLESVKGIGNLSAEGMKTLATFGSLKCLHVSLRDRRHGYRGPTGLSHLAGLGALEELAILSQDPLSDRDLASLAPLSSLRDLTIASDGTGERGVAAIGRLKQLERLTLWPVSRKALNHLNGLSNLQTLSVSAWHDAVGATFVDELTVDLSGLKKIKSLSLSLPLHDSDLAFLKHLPLLEDLGVQSTSPLTGASLRHLRELPELNYLLVNGLSDCTGDDVAHLNGLAKLRDLSLMGDITDSALMSLTGPLYLESLRVDTDNPIRKETVAELTTSHPVIGYIHIHDLTPAQAQPAGTPKRARVSRPRTNRQAPTNRRRGRR